MYLLCAKADGQGLSRSKLDPLPESEQVVSKLREKVASLTQQESSSFNLIYCGKILDDDQRRLESYGIRPSSVIQVMPKPQGEVPKVAPIPSTDENVQQFMLAFGMAVRNPNFTKIAGKAAKNLEDMCASVPGLDQDPVACAFLTKPELMLSLLHPDTFKYVAEKHPGLIEVANILAALVLESRPGDKDAEASGGASSGAGAGAAAANPFAYHLDEMSDDDDDEADYMEQEMDMDQAAPTNNQAAGFQPISAEQLRAALSAQGLGGDLFGGVTGMGPAATTRAPSMPPSASAPSTSSSASQMQSPITQDQLAAALAAATGGAPTPSSSSSAFNPFSFSAPAAPAPAAASTGSAATDSTRQAATAAGNANWDQEVAKMKEMGIVDEGLARKALQLMGGDLQAAIELIFSGWDGMDDSTN